MPNIKDKIIKQHQDLFIIFFIFVLFTRQFTCIKLKLKLDLDGP